MSSVMVITSIIVLLAGLVCYAFVAQTVVQKRQKKERLLAGLKSRARSFKYMLSSTPTNYLPKDLKLLVQRSLQNVLEQLAKLDPGESSYHEDLQGLTQQMAETQRQNDLAARKPLDNPQQAKEIKACLEELYKFIFNLESKRALSRDQADTFRAMVKQLVLELTVDSYVLHGRVAKEKEKYRLALHYFDLGVKLLIREGQSGQFDNRIAQLREVIADLQSRAQAEEEVNLPVPGDDGTPANAEWNEFGQENQDWKKKQIYD